MNSFNFGMGTPAGYGTPSAVGSYMQPAQPVVLNQLLTADEVAKLQKNPSIFSTKLTEDEYLRAVCTHKDRNTNQITLEKLPNGKHRCSVCQAEFYLIDLNTSKEEIENTCNNFYDLMQSIKTYYGNAPEAMREFYLMIGFLPKIQQLWNVAKTYFDKITNQFGGMNVGNDQSGFAVLSNLFGGGTMAGVAPGVGMGAPAGYYGAQPGYNGYGYGAPVPGWGQPQQGNWYAGAPVPQAAAVQAPGVAPAAGTAAAWGAPAAAPAPGGYGYNPSAAIAPAGTIPVGGSPNPIGYVDPTATPATNQAGQPVASTTQPPMPAPPAANPNVEKAEVTKTFAG